MDEDDEIELFILTRPRRLWLTRTTIQAKARRSAKRHISICPLVIATFRGLELSEHSTYLAPEIDQMRVVGGAVCGAACEVVRRSNAWVFDFLPNGTISGDTSQLALLSPSSNQKRLEWFLLLPPSCFIENWRWTNE